MARTGCGWGATANAASSTSVAQRPGRLRPFLLASCSSFLFFHPSLPLSLPRSARPAQYLSLSPNSSSFTLAVSLPLVPLCPSSSLSDRALSHLATDSPSSFLRDCTLSRVSLVPLRPSFSLGGRTLSRVGLQPLARWLFLLFPFAPFHQRHPLSGRARSVLPFRPRSRGWNERRNEEAERARRVNRQGRALAPTPMWLLPIDFVRVRGRRSNTCYRRRMEPSQLWGPRQTRMEDQRGTNMDANLEEGEKDARVVERVLVGRRGLHSRRGEDFIDGGEGIPGGSWKRTPLRARGRRTEDRR